MIGGPRKNGSLKYHKLKLLAVSPPKTLIHHHSISIINALNPSLRVMFAVLEFFFTDEKTYTTPTLDMNLQRIIFLRN